jgi:hypothetical protein
VVFPEQIASIDAQLARWLGQVPDGPAKSIGRQLGSEVAAAIIAAREGDGMDVVGTYSPDPAATPGDYQFVPPFDFVFRPAFGDAEPFALRSGSQFRPSRPPGLSSHSYAADYSEVKNKGELNGSTRSADESHQAKWWGEPAEMSWNRIANLLIHERRLDLYSAARGFALVNMALLDSYVAVWNAKRHFDRWRPYTAIHAGDDRNDDTDPDPAWQPFCGTPPTWEYPSASAMQSAAAADVLGAVLGTNRVSFTTSSTAAPPGQPTRSFTSLRRAAREAGNSRRRELGPMRNA